jgi:hypothetical protein
MAETHQNLLAVLNILDELGDVLHVTNLVEHAEDGFVGTTVTGTVEGGDSTSEGGVYIRLGRGHVTDSGGGAVELVLGVQDEEDLDAPDDFGVGAVVNVAEVGVHHVKEVLDVAEVLLRGDDGLADAVTVASGGDGWGLTNNAVDMLVTLLTSLVDVGTNVGWVGLRVEGAHGSHQGAHHSHRVSVVTESLDEGSETVVVRGVLHNFLVEAAELLGGGEFSVDEKESSLQESGVLSELLDGVATVLEDSLVTVDERNPGDAGDGVHVGGVVRAGHSSGSALDLSKISGVDSTILDGELVGLAYSE